MSLLQSDLEMQLGGGAQREGGYNQREWARVSIELSSTRELRYKCSPPLPLPLPLTLTLPLTPLASRLPPH